MFHVKPHCSPCHPPDQSLQGCSGATGASDAAASAGGSPELGAATPVFAATVLSADGSPSPGPDGSPDGGAPSPGGAAGAAAQNAGGSTGGSPTAGSLRAGAGASARPAGMLASSAPLFRRGWEWPCTMACSLLSWKSDPARRPLWPRFLLGAPVGAASSAGVMVTSPAVVAPGTGPSPVSTPGPVEDVAAAAALGSSVLDDSSSSSSSPPSP